MKTRSMTKSKALPKPYSLMKFPQKEDIETETLILTPPRPKSSLAVKTQDIGKETQWHQS